VSVIVPNYNHARYLRRRIDSILKQTFQDFELILLDDCSTDNSREILESYAGAARVRIEFNEQNSGTPFRQWNKGVRMARGKYVWIAESDDYAEPELLETLVAQLEKDPAVKMAYCRSFKADENDQVTGYAEWHMETLRLAFQNSDFVADGAEICRQVFTLTNPAPNASAVVFRREAYERVGGADEELRLCADYKIWALITLEGKIAYVARPLNYFQWHTQNARTRCQAGVLDLAEYFYVMEWILSRVAPPETPLENKSSQKPFRHLPASLSPVDRVRGTQHRIQIIGNWNLSHNLYVSQDAMRAYFRDWEFALIGKEFELSPPGRWQFFMHRIHFLRRYFPTLDWKARIMNLLRVVGAPVIGYRRRHLPERAFELLVQQLGMRRSM